MRFVTLKNHYPEMSMRTLTVINIIIWSLVLLVLATMTALHPAYRLPASDSQDLTMEPEWGVQI